MNRLSPSFRFHPRLATKTVLALVMCLTAACTLTETQVSSSSLSQNALKVASNRNLSASTLAGGTVVPTGSDCSPGSAGCVCQQQQVSTETGSVMATVCHQQDSSPAPDPNKPQKKLDFVNTCNYGDYYGQKEYLVNASPTSPAILDLRDSANHHVASFDISSYQASASNPIPSLTINLPASLHSWTGVKAAVCLDYKNSGTCDGQETPDTYFPDNLFVISRFYDFNVNPALTSLLSQLMPEVAGDRASQQLDHLATNVLQFQQQNGLEVARLDSLDEVPLPLAGSPPAGAGTGPRGGCNGPAYVEPLVLALSNPDGTPGMIHLTSVLSDPVSFALLGPVKGLMNTGWVEPNTNTYLLAWDKNGNGVIDDGTELFGQAMVLPDGSVAVNGFQALQTFDADGDGSITEADPIYRQIVLWDGVIGGQEKLISLKDAGVVSLSAQPIPVLEVSGGNITKLRSSFYQRVRGVKDLVQGALADVWFETDSGTYEE